MSTRTQLRFCPLIPLALLGCARKSAPPAAAPTANVVTITATEFAFVAPDTIPAGLTTLRMLNHGQELHQAVLMRFDSGKTMADLQGMMMKNPDAPPPPWLAFPMGPNIVVGGDSSNATATLVPGHYAMVCFMASHDGKLHVVKGMVRPLEVVASSGPVAPEPVADITITEKDYEFAVSAPITAGPHTIRVENAGPQVHEVALFQLAPGKTAKDFQTWLQGGMKGPPPARPMGGFTGPDPSGHGFFAATFAPGAYLLTCFVPDQKDGKPHIMHGMMKEITVS